MFEKKIMTVDIGFGGSCFKALYVIFWMVIFVGRLQTW